MRRRNFIAVSLGAAAASTVPPAVLHPDRPCECGLVTYRWNGQDYSATHILVDGRPTRFTYALHCWHNKLHRTVYS
jgi:hypothetical protein